jgi:hypothetical protein
MFVVHKALLNKRNLKNNAMPNYNFFKNLSFGIGFFFKYIKYFAFIAEKNEKNTYFQ